MGIENRPYAGTWKANKKQVLRYTPDCVVFLNGDTGLRSGRFERSQIDIQPFITQVSCDHGTTAGTASASISLAIPRHVGSAIFREGNTLLTIGLEVHIYMRGYFSVPGVHKQDSDHFEYEDIMGEIGGDEGGELEIPIRPYYHCFHGVTTNVSHEYSGGFYSAGLECTGMLHFWQYMDMSTNASLFGARPTGSNLRMSLVGHNFTGMTPFAIIYSLYKDTAGAAGGVAWALNNSGNINNQSRIGSQSLFQQTQEYWEKRFNSQMYRLKMYGVDGSMFSTAQTAMIGRMTSSQIDAALRSVTHNPADEIDASRGGARDPMRFNNLTASNAVQEFNDNLQLELGGAYVRDATVESEQFQQVRRLSEGSSLGLAVHNLQHYVTDISTYGAINLFESSYESKLDIAIAATEACGYEFYQDVDGDLVFKPPLYNMATKSSPVFCVKPRDVISISYAENEPEATYCTIKSEAFQNTNGVGLSGEWGVMGKFIDYKLVAKFGWRPADADMSYFSSGRAAFWGAVARLAIINRSMHTANLTIPLRPELRCGYPIYIEHIDTYYYIDSMSHAFSFGGQCTTSLQLVARRAKFCPPGDLSGDNGNEPFGGSCVRFDDPSKEPISIKAVHTVDGSTEVRKIEEMGFPNVVMALDTAHLNPLTWALGIDATDVNSVVHVNTLLMWLYEQQALTIDWSDATVEARNPSTWKGVRWAASFNTTYRGNTQQVVQDIDIGKLFEQVNSYATAREQAQTDLHGERQQTSQASAELQQRIRDLEDQIVAESFGQTIEQYSERDTFQTTIFTLLQRAMDITGSGNEARTSADILNVLGDRKAMFNNASTPGYYRYFSCSHPDPNHHAPTPVRIQPPQGSTSAMPIPEVDGAVSANVDNSGLHSRLEFKSDLSGVDLTPYALDEDHQNSLKKGMLHVRESGDNTRPRGFRVAPGRLDDGARILPSHMITKLEFCNIPLQHHQLVRSGQTIPDFVPDSGIVSLLRGKIINHMANTPVDATIEQALGDFMSSLAAINTINPTTHSTGTQHSNHNDLFGKSILSPLEALWSRTSGNNLQRLTAGEGVEMPSLGWVGGALRFSEFVNDTASARQPYHKAWLDPRLTLNRIFHVGTSFTPAPTGGGPRPPYENPGTALKDASKNFNYDGTNYADGTVNIHQVPLNVLPLVCSAFAGSRYYNGWRRNMDASRYDKSKIKLGRIKRQVAQIIAEAVNKRLWQIAGQYKEMWKQYFPDGVAKGSTQELAAWQELVEYGELVAEVTGSQYSVTGRPMFTAAQGVRVGNSNDTFVPTAVFPVSDNDGYEHFGCYAYGRGVDIAPGGTFQDLHNQDPLTFLGDMIDTNQEDQSSIMDQIDTFSRSLIQTGASVSQRQKDLAALARSIETQSSTSTLQAFFDHPMVNIDWESYLALDADEQVESYGANKSDTNPVHINARTATIMLGLMNLFASPGRPQQVQNSAYTLADLYPLGAESNGINWVDSGATLTDSFVKFDSYDANNFVYVSSGEGHSSIEDFVKNQMLTIAIDWGITQETYRGKYEIPYTMPSLDGITDSWENMFGEGSGEFWKNQTKDIYDSDTGEGLFVDMVEAAGYSQDGPSQGVAVVGGSAVRGASSASQGRGNVGMDAPDPFDPFDM